MIVNTQLFTECVVVEALWFEHPQGYDLMGNSCAGTNVSLDGGSHC
jgi:hypothetical protein